MYDYAAVGPTATTQGTSMAHCLMGQSYGDNDELNDGTGDTYWVFRLPEDAMAHCLFVIFQTCLAGAPDPDPNHNTADMLQACIDKGADCAAGFQGEVALEAIAYWSGQFWFYTVNCDGYVDASAIQAVMDAEAHQSGWTGLDSIRCLGGSNLKLMPARYG
jgi:hypothetical protein